jgi:hypothetical protein
METLLGSSIDEKNIGLAKTLFSLRHDLDVHCLISVNATKINQTHPGKFFLGHVAMRAIDSIALAICKIYEHEKGYELNSIQGVLNTLKSDGRDRTDESTVKDFLKKHGGPADTTNVLDALQVTFDGFKIKYRTELERLRWRATS